MDEEFFRAESFLAQLLSGCPHLVHLDIGFLEWLGERGEESPYEGACCSLESLRFKLPERDQNRDLPVVAKKFPKIKRLCCLASMSGEIDTTLDLSPLKDLRLESLLLERLGFRFALFFSRPDFVDSPLFQSLKRLYLHGCSIELDPVPNNVVASAFVAIGGCPSLEKMRLQHYDLLPSTVPTLAFVNLRVRIVTYYIVHTYVHKYIRTYVRAYIHTYFEFERTNYRRRRNTR